ncbi:hypothetical protein B296_00032808, partial [Ensete ventricosum]
MAIAGPKQRKREGHENKQQPWFSGDGLGVAEGSAAMRRPRSPTYLGAEERSAARPSFPGYWGFGKRKGRKRVNLKRKAKTGKVGRNGGVDLSGKEWVGDRVSQLREMWCDEREGEGSNAK